MVYAADLGSVAPGVEVRVLSKANSNDRMMMIREADHHSGSLDGS